MKSNILRAFKACLLRRKISKSPSCNTIASFYAGPEHLRDLDDSTHDSVAPSNIPTFIISSPSQCEAMLTAASVVEIEVRADDDGDYEGHPNRDTISTLSSITCVESFAESEDVFSVAEDVSIVLRKFEDSHADTTPSRYPLVPRVCAQRRPTNCRILQRHGPHPLVYHIRGVTRKV